MGKYSIKCLKCGDIITSNYRHDFKQCKCERCMIDGGNDYLRYAGNPGEFEIFETAHIVSPRVDTQTPEWDNLIKFINKIAKKIVICKPKKKTSHDKIKQTLKRVERVNKRRGR